MWLKFFAGRYLAKLPMEPKLGKMLILGAILGCLDPILTVAAGLSVRDPFLTPLDKKDVSLSPTMYKIKCNSTTYLYSIPFIGLFYPRTFKSDWYDVL